jgi:hypothetical protein
MSEDRVPLLKDRAAPKTPAPGLLGPEMVVRMRTAEVLVDPKPVPRRPEC